MSVIPVPKSEYEPAGQDVQLATVPPREYDPALHALHVAAVKTPPEEQEDWPETINPALHEGWQVLPAARVLVQVPTAPFVGAVAALQLLAEHVAAVSVPAKQLEVPDTV